MRDTELVLGKLNWVAASVALAIVGISTFTQPFGRPRNMVSEITAFAIAAATLALWTAGPDAGHWVVTAQVPR